MSPRQRLTPRCSAKPTRHPAHPDVHPHAVSKRQLTLRFDEIDGNGISGNAYNPNFDTNVLFCTPQEGQNRPTTPHIAMFTTMLIKMIMINMIFMMTFSIRREKPMVFWLLLWTTVLQHLKMISLKRKTMTTIFNPKVKTNAFLKVLWWRWIWMTSSQIAHFQSEGKNQCFFKDFVCIIRFASFSISNPKGKTTAFSTI